MMTTLRRILIMAALVALPMAASAREFINNLMNINLGSGYALPSGGIIAKERKFPLVVDTLPYLQVAYPRRHWAVSYCLSVDLMPIPAFILGDESNAVKIGVRAGYRFETMRQQIEVKRYNQSSYHPTGDLIRQQNWLAGPVIRYAPFIKYDPITNQYGSRWGFTMFATAGTITYGRLESRASRISLIQNGVVYLYYLNSPTAAVNYWVQQAQGVVVFRSVYRGYRIDAGAGVECAIFYMNVGFNCYYSRIFMKLEKPILGFHKEHYDQVTFEGYLSIPIEWSFFPRVF